VELDFIQYLRRLEAEARASEAFAGADFAGSMSRLMAWANRQQPHADWLSLAKLDLRAELGAGRAWLRRVFAARPPGFKTHGAWFGLGELADEDGVEFADLRIGLLGNYNPEDPSGEWLHSEPSWYPQNAALESPALRSAGLICNRQRRGLPAPLGVTGNILFSTAFATLLLRHTLDANAYRLLAARVPIGIATGFDSGDALLIGELTSKGFAANPRGFA
jgi:hypothetical protein